MNPIVEEPERRAQVDCLGLRCPEPILRTAKAAQGLGAHGGLLEIEADDAAFPIDLKSWCRSTSAELLSFEERDASFRALVRVGVAPASTKPASKARPNPSPMVLPAEPKVSPRADVKVLDYRGKLCPEPIVELAKQARNARSPLEVLADDPAFPLDLKSWCRSSGATSEVLSIEGNLHRVLVFPKGVSRESLMATVAAPMIAATTSPSSHGSPAAPLPMIAATAAPIGPAAAASTAPVVAAPIVSAMASTFGPAVTPSSSPSSASTARFDLRALSRAELDEELAQIGKLRPGTGITLFVPDSAGQHALRWCTAGGHELRTYTGGGQLELVLGQRSVETPQAKSTALVPVRHADAYDCALLVMHNDLESLLGALLVANSAAAQGMRTMLFFTFWGLNLLRADRPNLLAPKEPVSFMQRMFKWMMPKGPRRQGLGQLNFGGMGASIMQGIMQKKNISDLPSLITSAEQQGVRFVACTMSMAVMGITKRDLEPYGNLEFGGVATFVEAGRHAPLSLVF